MIGAGVQFIPPIQTARLVVASASFGAGWFVLKSIVLERKGREKGASEQLIILAGVVSVVLPLLLALFLGRGS